MFAGDPQARLPQHSMLASSAGPSTKFMLPPLPAESDERHGRAGAVRRAEAGPLSGGGFSGRPHCAHATAADEAASLLGLRVVCCERPKIFLPKRKQAVARSTAVDIRLPISAVPSAAPLALATPPPPQITRNLAYDFSLLCSALVLSPVATSPKLLAK